MNRMVPHWSLIYSRGSLYHAKRVLVYVEVSDTHEASVILNSLLSYSFVLTITLETRLIVGRIKVTREPRNYCTLVIPSCNGQIENFVNRRGS